MPPLVWRTMYRGSSVVLARSPPREGSPIGIFGCKVTLQTRASGTGWPSSRRLGKIKTPDREAPAAAAGSASAKKMRMTRSDLIAAPYRRSLEDTLVER